MEGQLRAAFSACGYDETFAKVVLSNRPDLCEYQCNGSMAAAKAYRKKPMSPALIRLWFGKSPMAEKLLHRHALYNHAVEELRELEAAEKALVIRPSSPIQIGRMEKNPNTLQSVYDLGVKDGLASLAAVKKYLCDGK